MRAYPMIRLSTNPDSYAVRQQGRRSRFGVRQPSASKARIRRALKRRDRQLTARARAHEARMDARTDASELGPADRVRGFDEINVWYDWRISQFDTDFDAHFYD